MPGRCLILGWKRAVGVALAGLMVLGAQAVRAGGLASLNAFMSDARSMRAEFRQVITDRSGKRTQDASGTFEFSRPGRFRWVYQKPWVQTIVGDGQKVWIHDPDLNQVTVRRLDAALGATPAALLAGNNEALRAFVIEEEPAGEGLEWVRAVPRERDGSFARIRLGFNTRGIAVMELLDGFGQQTLITFTSVTGNPRLDPALFRFTPPRDADVVGE
jgi:outer membrane lipoprotein carrier protein